MENHEKDRQDGTTNLKAMVTVLASTGLLGVMGAGMMAIANDARIAISVAEQHGQEILLLRGELQSLRVEMLERTQSRYTAHDAERHETYMEGRMERLEQQMERCCSRD